MVKKSNKQLHHKRSYNFVFEKINPVLQDFEKVKKLSRGVPDLNFELKINLGGNDLKYKIIWCR